MKRETYETLDTISYWLWWVLMFGLIYFLLA